MYSPEGALEIHIDKSVSTQNTQEINIPSETSISTSSTSTSETLTLNRYETPMMQQPTINKLFRNESTYKSMFRRY